MTDYPPVSSGEPSAAHPTSGTSDDEYAAFIGPNATTYLPLFRKYAVNPNGFNAGWNWAAFFFSFWWYLYRKMYLWAAVCFVTMMLPYFNLIIWLAWAVAANQLYYKHAETKMQEVRAVHGASYFSFLPDAGGVNRWVPWVAIIISGGFLLVLVTLGLLGFFLNLIF